MDRNGAIPEPFATMMMGVVADFGMMKLEPITFKRTS
jgi:hypothetical protein